MTIVMKRYFTIKSTIIEPDDPFLPPQPPIPPPTSISIADPIAQNRLPDWFTNADKKYRKIVRVLGATANKLSISLTPDPEVVVSFNGGWRLYSNLDTRTNLKMKTANTANDALLGKYVSSNIGFIMMVNNYNSIKEYDITDENMTDVKFYIRPWTYWTDITFYIDCVVELELMLVDTTA